MRTHILKFKSLVLASIIAFSFMACNDDDDDGSTFLEKNGDTVWKFEEPVLGGDLYAQINNSVVNPFEVWQSLFEDSCYIYISFADEGDAEIIENSENKLVFRIDDSSTEYVVLTLSVSGDVLTVITEDYEDGSKVDQETILLNKSSDNPDDLEECDF